MRIRKAVITAAGMGTRHFPATRVVQKELFPLVDVDGLTKPTIQLAVEQTIAAGIQAVCVVVGRGEADAFWHHFGGLSDSERLFFERAGKDQALAQAEHLAALGRRMTFVEQEEPHGFGHAVWCAKAWVGSDPFLLLLGDHVFLSASDTSCVSQTVSGFEVDGYTLLGVTPTPIDRLSLFGTVAGEPLAERRGAYRVTEIVEKPDPTTARQRLVTPGLPVDHFLTLFGIYAFTPELMAVLDRHVREDRRVGGEIQLTPAIRELIAAEGVHALEIQGQRLDMGTPLGYLETQLALARRGVFRHHFHSS